MPQFVYVLEVVRDGGRIRAHFAQTAGAAQRVARKYVGRGVRVPTPDPAIPARLLDGDTELARVVREVVPRP